MKKKRDMLPFMVSLIGIVFSAIAVAFGLAFNDGPSVFAWIVLGAALCNLIYQIAALVVWEE